MRAPLAVVAVVLLLAGCYTRYDLIGAEWTRPDTMIPQTTQDEMECVREAREAGSTPDLIVGGLVDVARYVVEEGQRRGAYERCMSDRGYRSTGS